MSKLFEGKISHDRVKRFLSQSYFDSTNVWQKDKLLVRVQERLQEGVLIADDTIIEKAHTDESAASIRPP